MRVGWDEDDSIDGCLSIKYHTLPPLLNIYESSNESMSIIHKVCVGRMRAPSESESDNGHTSDSSSDEERYGALELFEPSVSSDLLLSDDFREITRDELMNRVERSCEVRASRAVTTSTPYQSRCRTLSSARKESNRKFQVLMITNNRESEEQATVHTKMRKAADAAMHGLKELHDRERNALEHVEQELTKYKEAEKERNRIEMERIEAEEAKQRFKEEQRKKEQEDAAHAESEKQIEKEEKPPEVEKPSEVEPPIESPKTPQTTPKTSTKTPKDYEVSAQERIKRLETLHVLCQEILANPDPSIKAVRVDIKRQAGACNQISAAPSSIRTVVDKIHHLLNMAKQQGELCFQFALDIVANNLTKQARVVLDYKACYPLAHVIMMSCVHTPELVDIILAYLFKMCMFTIPTYRHKLASESTKEYRMAIGFEPSIGDSSDPDGLEHFTVYAKRMTMISAVLAATMQTTPWDNRPAPSGLSLGDCWVWLARLVNEPANLMTSHLVLTILEVAGYELWRNYNKQFHKLILLIANDVIPQLNRDAKSGGANAIGQLEIWIQQYQMDGNRLSEPSGRRLEETKLSQADEERTDGDESGGGYSGGYGGGRGYSGGRGRGRGRGRR